VLLKVPVPLEIPRSLVLKVGLDGEARSWTVLVYVLNSELLGGGPSDEEDPKMETLIPTMGSQNSWPISLISL
jgi:hypothetical protein